MSSQSLTPKALLEQHSSYTQYLYNDEHKIIFAVNPKVPPLLSSRAPLLSALRSCMFQLVVLSLCLSRFPQVMSTSSKMIVDALRHNGVVRDRIPTHGELQYVNEAPAAHQAEMFATYERVVFVRNPYARLYSAWTNKYRDMPGTCKNVTGSKGDTRVKCNEFYNNWVSIGRRIYSHAGLVAPEDTQELLRGVTWPMFINAVVAGAARDRHWITQVGGAHTHTHGLSFFHTHTHMLSCMTHTLSVPHTCALSLRNTHAHTSPLSARSISLPHLLRAHTPGREVWLT